MATHSGTAGSVVLVSGGTTVVGEINEWNATIVQNTPDVSSFGDQWGEVVPGIRRITGSFQGFEDGSNAVQGTLKSMIMNGSAAAGLRLYEDGSKYLSGSALIVEWNPAQSLEGVATTSFSFTGTGAWTYT